MQQQWEGVMAGFTAFTTLEDDGRYHSLLDRKKFVSGFHSKPKTLSSLPRLLYLQSLYQKMSETKVFTEEEVSQVSTIFLLLSLVTNKSF